MRRGRDLPSGQEKEDGEYLVYFPSSFSPHPEGKSPPERKKINL